jgi:hypothetical protein
MKKSLIGIAAAALALAPAFAYAEDDAPGQVADASTASGAAAGSGISTYVIVGGVVVLLGVGAGIALSGNSGTKSTSSTTK